MRTLKSQNLIHDQNYALFPQGAIINETDSVEGTPVVREVYNDLLMNVYALVKDRKINFNNLEDNEQNGYQLINALKLVFNDYTDSVKILSKPGVDWFLDVDLSLVPVDCVFFVRSSEDVSSESVIDQTFKDRFGVVRKFTAKTNIKTGDDCILIVNNDYSRIYSLNPKSIQKSNLDNLITFGNPITLNESFDAIWYLSNGVLSNMQLNFQDIGTFITNQFGPDTILKNVLQVSGDFLCLIYNQVNFKYKVVSFKNNTFNQLFEVSAFGQDISENPTEDLDVHFYADEVGGVFFSNQAGNSDDNYSISKYTYDRNQNQLAFQANFNLDIGFEKNTNTVVSNQRFIVLSNIGISIFNLDGVKSTIPTYGQLIGQLFQVKNNIYFNDGHNALKLNI